MAQTNEEDANQDTDAIPKQEREKLERAAFESSYIIDNPTTNVVLSKKCFRSANAAQIWNI